MKPVNRVQHAGKVTVKFLEKSKQWLVYDCPVCHGKHYHEATEKELQESYRCKFPHKVGTRVSQCYRHQPQVYDLIWDGRRAHFKKKS